MNLKATALVPVTPPFDARMPVPALIAGAGKRAAWRFVEFFTVNIRNPNTRARVNRYCRPRGGRQRGHGVWGVLDCRGIQRKIWGRGRSP